jgi:hypothetical protein
MAFFPSGTYDLFLTHAWYYTDEWQGLVAMLDEYVPGKWRNWSIPWHDTSIERHTEDGRAALEKLLRGHILMSSAILLLPETRNMPDGKLWLEKQLGIGAEYSKPVIGIRARDNHRFPQDLVGCVCEIVDRNASQIIAVANRLRQAAK